MQNCLGGKFRRQEQEEKRLKQKKEDAENKEDDEEASRKNDASNNLPKKPLCFPGDAVVTTEAGQVAMKDLTIALVRRFSP